jgi:possible xylulokinase
MAWVKEHEPEIFADAYKVMDVHGYVAWMLTGRPVSSQAAADSLGLFDIQKRDWSDELLDIAGVSREQMVDLVEPSYEMGTLRKELAEEWGIAEVPVIAGLGDGQAAGIGAAAVDPQIGFLNLSTAVNAGVDSPVYRYDKVFRTHVSGIPGNYVFEVLQSSGSYLAGWFRETLDDRKLLGAPDPALDEAASLIPPG